MPILKPGDLVSSKVNEDYMWLVVSTCANSTALSCVAIQVSNSDKKCFIMQSKSSQSIFDWDGISDHFKIIGNIHEPPK